MTGKRKRILLLITNLTFGGAQRVLYDQAKVLAEEYDVYECVFNDFTTHAFPTGNPVLNLDVKAGTNFFDKIFRFFQRVIRLRKVKHDYQIDFCISHLEGADLVNVASRRKEKIITWVHGSKLHDQNISGMIGFIRHKLLIPWTYSRANVVITVSGEIRKELIDHYRVKSDTVKTIYNSFDVRKIQVKSNEPVPTHYSSIFEDLPVLVFSGRLAKQKNPRALLEWFSSFVQKYPSKLLILGDGELRDELLKYGKTLQLKIYHPWADLEINNLYQVYFIGFQDNPHAFIKRSNVFLLPSLWEGFPMALGEAMACGLPVVSADCPTGPKEMLTQRESGTQPYPVWGEFGVLMPLLVHENYETWTTTLVKLLSDENLLNAYSKKAIQRADHFSKERNDHKIIDLLRSV